MGVPQDRWFISWKIPSRNGWFVGSLISGNLHMMIYGLFVNLTKWDAHPSTLNSIALRNGYRSYAALFVGDTCVYIYTHYIYVYIYTLYIYTISIHMYIYICNTCTTITHSSVQKMFCFPTVSISWCHDEIHHEFAHFWICCKVFCPFPSTKNRSAWGYIDVTSRNTPVLGGRHPLFSNDPHDSPNEMMKWFQFAHPNNHRQ